jgi:hypothetical protein
MLDSTQVRCPWCGERFEAVVDCSGGSSEYTEDCPVCCRPITFRLDTGPDGDFEGIGTERED